MSLRRQVLETARNGSSSIFVATCQHLNSEQFRSCSPVLRLCEGESACLYQVTFKSTDCGCWLHFQATSSRAYSFQSG